MGSFVCDRLPWTLYSFVSLWIRYNREKDRAKLVLEPSEKHGLTLSLAISSWFAIPKAFDITKAATLIEMDE